MHLTDLKQSEMISSDTHPPQDEEMKKILEVNKKCSF